MIICSFAKRCGGGSGCDDDSGGGGALTAFNKASRQCEQTDCFRAPARLQVTTLVVVVAVVPD